MNYYNEIKTELIKNEAYKQVKEYSKNRHDLETYYNVGKLLIEAQGGEERAKYGNGLIKEYSKKLTEELGKSFSYTLLKNCRSFFLLVSNSKGPTMSDKLTWSHYVEMIPLNNINLFKYYQNIAINHNLSVRELRERIKSKEYERLSEETKQKLKSEEQLEVTDLVPNPILIETKNRDLGVFDETVLRELIIENLDAFLKQLGNGFTYIGKEYKLQDLREDRYIDILLFNYIYNCFVVIELKRDKVKDKDIGQIHTYMNYIDRTLKTPLQNRTVGIIISKENDRFVVKYCTDDRISFKEYLLVNNEKEGKDYELL